MEFKQISRSTYERNKKAGKFRVISETADGALVEPKFIRGNYGNERNKYGATVKYDFKVSRAEIEAQDAKAHADMMTRIRAKRGE